MTKKLFVFTLLLLNKVFLMRNTILDGVIKMGVGVVKDDKEAVRLFSLAAQQG